MKGTRKEGIDGGMATTAAGTLTRATALAPMKTIKRIRTSRVSLPRFQYSPNRVLDLSQIPDGHIQVQVCTSHLTARNDGIKKRLLWGPTANTKNSVFEYTQDSDVVAMLVHSGFIALPRSRSATSTITALIATLKVKRGGSPKFISYESNNIRSRAWEGKYRGPRIAISRVFALDSKGVEVDVPPHVSVQVVNIIPRIAPPEEPIGLGAPTSSSASTNANNTIATEPITFDLSNRPSLVFTLSAVADRGHDRTLWPSKRLSREVMYIETSRKRFEICRTEAPERKADGAEKRREDGKEKKKGLYVRFSEVNRRVIQRELFDDQLTSAPLKEADLVSSAVYRWSALKWDMSGLSVGGMHYVLKRVSFRAKKDQVDEQEDAVGGSNHGHAPTQRPNTNST